METNKGCSRILYTLRCFFSKLLSSFRSGRPAWSFTFTTTRARTTMQKMQMHRTPVNLNFVKSIMKIRCTGLSCNGGSSDISLQRNARINIFITSSFQFNQDIWLQLVKDAQFAQEKDNKFGRNLAINSYRRNEMRTYIIHINSHPFDRIVWWLSIF